MSKQEVGTKNQSEVPTGDAQHRPRSAQDKPNNLQIIRHLKTNELGQPLNHKLVRIATFSKCQVSIKV